MERRRGARFPSNGANKPTKNQGESPLFVTVSKANDPDHLCMVRLIEGDDSAFNPWMKLRARMKLMTGIFLSPLKRHRQVWQSGRNLLSWSEMRLIGFLTISKQLSYYLSTKTFLMMRSAGSWDVRQRR